MKRNLCVRSFLKIVPVEAEVVVVGGWAEK
jgi:hypothetical protein